MVKLFFKTVFPLSHYFSFLHSILVSCSFVSSCLRILGGDGRWAEEKLLNYERYFYFVEVKLTEETILVP